MIQRQSIRAFALLAGMFASANCSGPGNSTSAPPPAAQAQGAVSQPGSPQAPASSPQANNDPRFLASDLPILPTGVVMAAAPLDVMRTTYEFAARHPEVMNYMPCFCGCERGGHKGNHDCFVASRDAGNRVTSWDTHAINCEICIDVAYRAWQMHNSGASVSAIRDAIEKRYASKTAEGLHTPTPWPPKRGGTSHD